jgi:uncharacterized membrane protein YhaH (DUF805 family)
MVFCRGCGAQIHETAPMCPRCGAPQEPAYSSDPADQRPRTFGTSVAICFNRYFQFGGRAPRAEYWYFVLFTVLVGVGADIVDAVWLGFGQRVFSGIVNIAFFIPGLAVLTRRMHDLDRSGWWWLLMFIPLIGWLVLLIWACTRGSNGPNRYGPDPLRGIGVPISAAAAAE